jgi:hypothetical protein
MAYTIPGIVKAAERFMADLEIAVTRFPRAHRYTLGSDLRHQAMEVTRLAHRAWRDRTGQLAPLDALSEAIDDLKLRLQLGSQVRAFVSFAQFEALARSLSALGRQCGGWRKQRSAKGQNAQPAAAVQRPLMAPDRYLMPIRPDAEPREAVTAMSEY